MNPEKYVSIGVAFRALRDGEVEYIYGIDREGDTYYYYSAKHAINIHHVVDWVWKLGPRNPKK